ncbi:hypothetical protein GCM10009737_14520 [Nocardioides lentus]|uniref:DUF1963 domain-containing protein n=1 Tax=Nocardioides lentus TaxID=338077 RepID=A0ABP5AHI6_9ACTN
MTSSLVTQWQDLVARAPSAGARRLDRDAERLYAATRRALAEDPVVRRELVLAFAAAGDAPLARWLAGAVLPPGLGASTDPEGFRAHPEVRLSATELPIAVGLALSTDHELVADPAFRADPLGWTGSWIGGTPSVPRRAPDAWGPPVGSDGRALHFVLQVDLATEAVNQGLDRWPSTGLPDTGVLQVFHDLRSDGWDDASAGAWLVRLVDDVDDMVLADAAAVDRITPLNPQLVATCPSPAGSRLAGERAERHARAARWLDLVAVRANATDPDVHALTPWHEAYEPVAPVPRLRGFGRARGDHPELLATLALRLPLAPGDRHVLLLDADLDLGPLPPGAGGAGAEARRRHLEVWMRARDLTAGRFASTWAVVRTGA